MCASSIQISALVLRAQASEVLLEELQQSFSQAKRDVQEQMVSQCLKYMSYATFFFFLEIVFNVTITLFKVATVVYSRA